MLNYTPSRDAACLKSAAVDANTRYWETVEAFDELKEAYEFARRAMLQAEQRREETNDAYEEFCAENALTVE